MSRVMRDAAAVSGDSVYDLVLFDMYAHSEDSTDFCREIRVAFPTQNIAWLVGGQQQFNYDGDRTDSQAQAYYENMFLNYWKIRSFAIYHPTVLDDRLTRGGPVVMRTGYKFGMLELSTDARKWAVADFQVQRSGARRASRRESQRCHATGRDERRGGECARPGRR